MANPVRYHVALERPHEHLYRVEARFPVTGEDLLLWMPVWTPGSYLVREFARHVQGFRALGSSGAALPVDRAGKNRWRILCGGEREVSVAYLVYANELTVRTSHLDESHAFFNGANLFVTSDTHRTSACALSVATPPGWRVLTSLPGNDGALWARDFDELVDSPVEAGPHAPFDFAAAGKPHQLVVWGKGNFDSTKLTRDLTAICETEAAIFGGLPFERYLFLVHLSDKGRGGLEHAASTVLLYPRFGFTPAKAYEEFLALAAHEYFHLWNVKRILPRAFVPFDYHGERFTRLLWAMEGITSYYDSLVLRRAGLIDASRWLERMGETITGLESLPARRVQSLADSSYTAWIKHYRQDENTPNSGISYYVKGEIVAMLLDLNLRSLTKGAKSLDDLMRLLFARYGRGEGVPEDGVELAACELGGDALKPFFERSLRGVDDLDYSVLAAAGLALRRRVRKGAADKGGTPEEKGKEEPEKAWLGVDLKPGERAVVASVLAGSPGAREGVYADDEIVAIDGFRVTGASLAERLDDRRPGDRAELTLFRRDELVRVSIELSARPREACWLERLPDASPEQKALFEAWLKEPFTRAPAAP